MQNCKTIYLSKAKSSYQDVQLEQGQEAVNEQEGALLALAVLCSQVAGDLAVHSPPKLAVAGNSHAEVQGQEQQNDCTYSYGGCGQMVSGLQSSRPSRQTEIFRVKLVTMHEQADLEGPKRLA